MPPKQNTKPPGPSQKTRQSLTPEDRKAGADRRFQLIQEALQASHTTPPSRLPAIPASSVTSPTSTPCPLQYRSQSVQTSLSWTRTTANISNSPATFDGSSESESKCHGGALASTGNDSNLDGSDAPDCRSFWIGLTPPERPRSVVVILDSDEEVSILYPIAASPDRRSQGSFSPPPPGQRPRPRTPSPSPSWEYVPMPGAFPATPCGTDKPTSPNYREVSDDYYEVNEDEKDFL